VKNQNSRLASILKELLTREIQFLDAKASKILLEGLRQRIANGFYLLCQEPSFNIEAKNFQKVPWDTVKLRKDMIQCKGINIVLRYLMLDELLKHFSMCPSK